MASRRRPSTTSRRRSASAAARSSATSRRRTTWSGATSAGSSNACARASAPVRRRAAASRLSARAVVASNRYEPEQLPELRIRMTLITTVPALQAHSMLRYDGVARRRRRVHRRPPRPAPDDLVPQTIGHLALGTRWPPSCAGSSTPRRTSRRTSAAGIGCSRSRRCRHSLAVSPSVRYRTGMEGLGLVKLAGFTSSLDRMLISPMLVTIAVDLGVSLKQPATAASAYFLLYGLTQPVWGVLSDRLGRVRTMRLALVGAAVAGTASSDRVRPLALTIARGFAGAFVGAVIPASLVYIGDMVPFVPAADASPVMAASASATAISIVVGGAIAAVSWRAGFRTDGSHDARPGRGPRARGGAAGSAAGASDRPGTAIPRAAMGASGRVDRPRRGVGRVGLP